MTSSSSDSKQPFAYYWELLDNDARPVSAGFVKARSGMGPPAAPGLSHLALRVVPLFAGDPEPEGIAHAP